MNTFPEGGSSIADGALPTAISALLTEVAVARRYKKGQLLFDEGSRPAAMFGVLSGHVGVSLADSAHDQRLATLLGPGQWFGEAPLLDEKARAFTAMAHSECRIAVVTATAFNAVITTHPEALLAITKLVCARYRQSLAWIEDNVLQSLEVRLARRILALCPEGATALPRVSQELLASQLGVSRPTLNRQLAQWARLNLLSVGYGRLQVIDREALRRLARVTAR